MKTKEMISLNSGRAEFSADMGLEERLEKLTSSEMQTVKGRCTLMDSSSSSEDPCGTLCPSLKSCSSNCSSNCPVLCGYDYCQYNCHECPREGCWDCGREQCRIFT